MFCDLVVKDGQLGMVWRSRCISVGSSNRFSDTPMLRLFHAELSWIPNQPVIAGSRRLPSSFGNVQVPGPWAATIRKPPAIATFFQNRMFCI